MPVSLSFVQGNNLLDDRIQRTADLALFLSFVENCSYHEWVLNRVFLLPNGEIILTLGEQLYEELRSQLVF